MAWWSCDYLISHRLNTDTSHWVTECTCVKSLLGLEARPRLHCTVSLSLYGSFKIKTSHYTQCFCLQEWEILTNSSERVRRPREGDVILMYSQRVSLKFTLSLRRRLGFTALLVMLLCVFLSFLIPLIFCLPPERPDRHMIGIAMMFSPVLMNWNNNSNWNVWVIHVAFFTLCFLKSHFSGTNNMGYCLPPHLLKMKGSCQMLAHLTLHMALLSTFWLTYRLYKRQLL